MRLKLFLILAGGVEGVLMVQHGAHTVGAKDGLEGLFFLDWSRNHGDQRGTLLCSACLAGISAGGAAAGEYAAAASGAGRGDGIFAPLYSSGV